MDIPCTNLRLSLGTAAEDYTTLRQYMVDYGFLGRTRDGAEYWVE